MAVAQSSCRVTKSKGKGQFWVLRVFFPNDNALYSIAFGTHKKRLNRSRCRFGWWVAFSRGTACYVRGGDDPRRGRVIFGENVPNVSSTRMNWLDWPCNVVHTIETDAWLRALHEYIIGREGEGLHTVGEVWYRRSPCFYAFATRQCRRRTFRAVRLYFFVQTDLAATTSYEWLQKYRWN